MKIKYGMLIRLRHVSTNHLLKSLDKRFPCPPSASGQQMVVATNDGSDSSTIWRVKSKDGTPLNALKGKSVKNGDCIRLEHLNTQTNLHSHPIAHGHLAPITRDGNQQEVTAVGAAGEGDDNDDWIIETQKGAFWLEKENIRLYHRNTNWPLHSHDNARHPVVTDGFQEVTAFGGKDPQDFWMAIRTVMPADTRTTTVTQRNRIQFVKKLLSSFSECAGYVLHRRKNPIIKMNSESRVQDVVYLALKPSIPDLQAEQPVVGGALRQYSIQDFRSPSLKIIIEAKFVRDKSHGKRLMAELNDDIGKYKNDPVCKDLIFFIYDPERHLEAPQALVKTIRGKHTHGKRHIKVHCLVER